MKLILYDAVLGGVAVGTVEERACEERQSSIGPAVNNSNGIVNLNEA